MFSASDRVKTYVEKSAIASAITGESDTAIGEDITKAPVSHFTRAVLSEVAFLLSVSIPCLHGR